MSQIELGASSKMWKWGNYLNNKKAEFTGEYCFQYLDGKNLRIGYRFDIYNLQILISARLEYCQSLNRVELISWTNFSDFKTARSMGSSRVLDGPLESRTQEVLMENTLLDGLWDFLMSPKSSERLVCQNFFWFTDQRTKSCFRLVILILLLALNHFVRLGFFILNF